MVFQHAALTRSEVYLVQFDVRESATGFHVPLSTIKPTLHPYPTFESKLPLTWGMSQLAVQVKSEDLLGSLPNVSREKPSFVCEYCHNQPYEKILSFWAHIYRKHLDIDQSERLEVIREGGAACSTYWQTCPEAKSRSKATLAKLKTAASATFSWEDVIRWNL